MQRYQATPVGRAPFTSRPIPALRAQQPRLQVCVRAQAAGKPSLQLATARIPPKTDLPAFGAALYQWAATLTSAGRNMPFALPLKVDKADGQGFQISLLRVVDAGQVSSVADLVATIEPVPGKGDVLFVRLYEGPASELLLGEKARASGDANLRLQTLLNGLVDVPQIMQTMPAAIKRAVMVAQ